MNTEQAKNLAEFVDKPGQELLRLRKLQKEQNDYIRLELEKKKTLQTQLYQLERRIVRVQAEIIDMERVCFFLVKRAKEASKVFFPGTNLDELSDKEFEKILNEVML